MPSDIKRYSRGSDIGDTDGKINEAIEKAESLFLPYVNNIDVIGFGNHEVSVLKYHHIDVIRMLIGFLNRKRDPSLPPIRHGGYTGYIRFVFEGPEKTLCRKFDIFYNHGQGGSAEVTDGIIDAKRRLYTRADLIWLGHKHKRWAIEIDPEEGLSDKGNIYIKKRWAVMTGTYSKSAGETNSTKDGYKINFGDEKMRTKQRTGGVHGKIFINKSGLYAEFII